jgi:hypothetical protein
VTSLGTPSDRIIQPVVTGIARPLAPVTLMVCEQRSMLVDTSSDRLRFVEDELFCKVCCIFPTDGIESQTRFTRPAHFSNSDLFPSILPDLQISFAHGIDSQRVLPVRIQPLRTQGIGKLNQVSSWIGLMHVHNSSYRAHRHRYLGCRSLQNNHVI